MMWIFLVFAVAVLLAAVSIAAQHRDAGSGRFDVVSIKQAAFTGDERASTVARIGMCARDYVEMSQRSVRIPVTTVCGLIRLAYDANDYEVIGIPEALSKDDPASWFEVQATMEGKTTPTLDDVRPMLQAMLAERFHLRVHRESREMAVYALVVAKGGPKLTSCANPEASSGYSPGRLVSCKEPRLPMSRVAQMLTREARRLVVDRTGITEPPSFELHWRPADAPDGADSLPELFTAIQEQLGLKLEPTRASEDVLIVDHVEPPTSN